MPSASLPFSSAALLQPGSANVILSGTGGTTRPSQPARQRGDPTSPKRQREDVPALALRASVRPSREFDRLRQNKKLKKIGRADLLIADLTVANGATLVTRNLNDFRQVPGLPVENWID